MIVVSDTTPLNYLILIEATEVLALIDERKASREAESRGLRVVGTLGILEEAGARNLLDYEKGRHRLVNETSFYVTDDVLRESGRRYHERKQAQGQDRETQE